MDREKKERNERLDRASIPARAPVPAAGGWMSRWDREPEEEESEGEPGLDEAWGNGPAQQQNAESGEAQAFAPMQQWEQDAQEESGLGWGGEAEDDEEFWKDKDRVERLQHQVALAEQELPQFSQGVQELQAKIQREMDARGDQSALQEPQQLESADHSEPQEIQQDDKGILASGWVGEATQKAIKRQRMLHDAQLKQEQQNLAARTVSVTANVQEAEQPEEIPSQAEPAPQCSDPGKGGTKSQQEFQQRQKELRNKFPHFLWEEK